MLSVNGKPLNDIITTSGGKVDIQTNTLNIQDSLSANYIYCNNVHGDKGDLINGIAGKAETLTDSNGNTLNVGSDSNPVYLKDGKPNTLNVLAVEHGGTGQTSLNSVKVGGASNADVSTK